MNLQVFYNNRINMYWLKNLKYVKESNIQSDLIFLYRYFIHFYTWGTVWIWSITIGYFSHCITQSSSFLKPIQIIVSTIDFITDGNLKTCFALTRHHVDVAVVLSMLSVQVLRRLYECVFVSIFSNSARIHLLHYFLGLFFYTAVPLTSLGHLDSMKTSDTTLKSSLSKLKCVCVFQISYRNN